MQRHTIDRLKAVLWLLANIGEISAHRMGAFKLDQRHLLMLLQSGLVCANPYSFLASPRMLRFMPFAESDDLFRKTGLQKATWIDQQAWAVFHERAFSQPLPEAFAGIGDGYIYTPIPDSIYEDAITRPVWFCSPVPKSQDLEEWNLFEILDLGFTTVWSEELVDWEGWKPWVIADLGTALVQGKHFVHGALVTEDAPHDELDFDIEGAIWGSPFYWLALQFLILSDKETGAAYDWKIALDCPTVLHRPLESPGALPISLDGRHVCDLSDVLDEILASFHWVWVNRPSKPAERRYALLSVLRLLAALDILERQPGGRLGLTDNFRELLFFSRLSYHERYRQSRNAREQIREIIKRKSGEGHA